MRNRYVKRSRISEKKFRQLVKLFSLDLDAVKKVNKMSRKGLYNTLLRDLEYEETRNYLKKVWERKKKYRT